MKAETKLRSDLTLGHLPAGTLLDGRYEVLRLIGEGTFATVYEVRHNVLHGHHAVKVLNPELAADEDVRARFVDEGRIQARLRHPHIVPVTEIVTDPVPGLVMDFIDGPNLGGYLSALGRRLEPREAIELLLPVIDAVAAAHRMQIVHRDLKPENILIGKDGRGQPRPLVTDFGIAKILEKSSLQSGKQRTQAHTRIGTPNYMSPEQIRAAHLVDARTDVFALGAILYELVTGQLAFDADNEFDLLTRIVQGNFRSPEEIVAGLPAELVACIRSALTIDPDTRPRSADALHMTVMRIITSSTPTPVSAPASAKDRQSDTPSGLQRPRVQFVDITNAASHQPLSGNAGPRNQKNNDEADATLMIIWSILALGIFTFILAIVSS